MTSLARKVYERFLVPRAEMFRNGYIVFGTQRDMVEEVGFSIALVNKALKELKDEGKVVMVKPGCYLLPDTILWEGSDATV